jgi:uncharacterized damage-inducible protein DinB
MPPKKPAKLSVQDNLIRHDLLEFLRGGHAHASFEDAVKGFPASLATEKPAGAPHSAWQLLEHIRLTLEDLLEFSTDPEYKPRPWPEGYWPQDTAPRDAAKAAAAWKRSVAATRKNIQGLEKLLQDSNTDLSAKIPWGDGQTTLREILLAGDHTSYHVGQLVFLRKQLDAWK